MFLVTRQDIFTTKFWKLCLHWIYFTAQKMSKYEFFFWSVFSGIWNGYEDLLHKSTYSVHIRENTDQKKTPYLDSFHLVFLLKTTYSTGERYLQLSPDPVLTKLFEFQLYYLNANFRLSHKMFSWLTKFT